MIKIDSNYAPTAELAKSIKNSKTDDERLYESCKAFEALFFNKILQIARKSEQDSGFIQKNNGQKLFEEMLDEEYSTILSESSTKGIGDILYAQLKAREESMELGKIESKKNNSELYELMHNEIYIDKIAKKS